MVLRAPEWGEPIRNRVAPETFKRAIATLIDHPEVVAREMARWERAARAGVIDWSADVTSPGLGVKGSDDGIDFTYGIGAQFRVWSLSLRAEYELYDVADSDTVDLVSVGVTWTFL